HAHPLPTRRSSDLSFALVVVSSVAVSLALCGFEEAALGIWVGGRNRFRWHNPYGAALIAAGVQIAAIAQCHRGIRRVQRTSVHVRHTAGGTNKDTPHWPLDFSHGVTT